MDNNLKVDFTYNDVGSGLNAKRKELKQEFKLITREKISEVMVTYSGRLTRFGFQYLTCISRPIELR